MVLLDPDVVLRSDAAAVIAAIERASSGAPPLRPEVTGTREVAEIFTGRALGAQLAHIDGLPGLIFVLDGRLFSAIEFVVENGHIIEISIVAQKETIASLAVEAETEAPGI